MAYIRKYLAPIRFFLGRGKEGKKDGNSGEIGRGEWCFEISVGCQLWLSRRGVRF